MEAHPVPRRQSLKPAVTLALITPVLTELLSGNIPAPKFFLPWIFGFLVIVYGLPVLLLRELYIRWNLALPGLFLLGLAYGIYNEGVCAKTLLLNENVPINAFDHDAWLGINFPWAALIVPWHAFHAIIFPIALVTWLFPDEARTSWLSWKESLGASILVIGLGVLVHLGNKQHVTSPIYLLLFALAMAALILTTRRASRNIPFLTPGTWNSIVPVAAGFTFYPVFVLSLAIAGGCKLPGFAICLLSLLILTFYYRLVVRKGWLALAPFTLFVLGDYFSGALFTGLTRLAKGFVPGVITGLILMGTFTYGILRLIQEGRRTLSDAAH